jgi:membrane protease YdiL (CAAX protease family)
MTNIANNPLFSAGWVSFFRFLMFAVGGLFVGQFAGLLAMLPFSPVGMMELPEVLSNPMAYPEMRIPLLIMQGITALFAFLIGPLFFIWFEGGFRFSDLSPSPKSSMAGFALVAVGVIVFMFVNSVVIHWNMNLQLPEFMSGFEQWARAKEDQLGELTSFIIAADTNMELVLVFLVVAVLPGVGEEVLFRGVIQNVLQGWFRNRHLAIWIAAILFSAIHFQFYGFVPRVILGAMFGYLYVFTGNIWYPIFAHFVNNGFSVLAMALYREGLTEFDIESVETVPLPLVISAAFIFVGVVYFFMKVAGPKYNPVHGKLAGSVYFRSSASS